jgi:uncharacterized phage protein (TIGR02216 family)
MAMGLGLLSLSPATLWSMTPKELEAAVRGRFGAAAVDGPPRRSELDGLMQQFPDRRSG